MIAKRRRKGVTEYQCVWKDYGVDGMTWEPLEHLGEHKSKVASLDKKVEVQLDRHRYLVQESLAKQLTRCFSSKE